MERYWGVGGRDGTAPHVYQRINTIANVLLTRIFPTKCEWKYVQRPSVNLFVWFQQPQPRRVGLQSLRSGFKMEDKK